LGLSVEQCCTVHTLAQCVIPSFVFSIYGILIVLAQFDFPNADIIDELFAACRQEAVVAAGLFATLQGVGMRGVVAPTVEKAVTVITVALKSIFTSCNIKPSSNSEACKHK
jgi:uncharacterized membrane protein